MKNTYAKFWKCALQVNPSTYSATYRGQSHNLDANTYIDELLKICLEEDINIVGIADHGDVSEVNLIREKFNTKGIIVFPGFEIASCEKIHWVCLFHENTTTEDLHRYLGSLRLTTSGDGVRPSTLGATDLIRHVHELGGFCYAAHITDDNGILHRGKMEQVWKNPLLQAAQIPGTIDELGDYKQIITNQNIDYKREKLIGIINAKDVDKPDVLRNPKASCYIKMTHPGFEAFKVAFKDPASRIRLHHEMKKVQYSSIEKIKFSGGYLDGIEIDLSSHLNAIIGGRGTGKSTVIECLRYVLDIKPKGKEAEKQHDQIIKENLGKEKARIEITLISSKQNGNRYKVIRRFGDRPRVIDDQGNESAMHPKDLLPSLEIYGQNEIYELAKDNTAILRVLDRFMSLDEVQYDDEIKIVQTKLRDNANKLEKIYTRKDTIEEDVNKLPILEEQRKDFQKLGIEQKLKIIPLLERERTLELSIGEEFEKRMQALENLAKSVENIDFINEEVIEPLPHKSLFKNAHTTLLNWQKSVDAIMESLTQKITETKESLAITRKAILDGIEKEEVEVEKQFSSIPSISGKTGTQIGEEYRRLLKQIERIKPFNIELGSLSESEKSYIQERRNLLGQLADLRFARTDKLKKIVKKISKKLKDKVLIEVIPENNRENLKDFLAKIPRIGQKKLAWVDDLETLNISTFATAINIGKEAIKDLKWGITDMVAEIFCSLSKEEKLALEEIDLQDRITIKLNVAHGTEANFRPLEKLSTGQQCTAILHLLLLENPEPLIMDQPEDNLDNAFIAERIVHELRSEKTKRQFIFATHNANIPVFGDAEWIGVFAASSEKAELDPEFQGSIDVPIIRDHVANILEGGRAAFIQRKEKYDF